MPDTFTLNVPNNTVGVLTNIVSGFITTAYESEYIDALRLIALFEENDLELDVDHGLIETIRSAVIHNVLNGIDNENATVGSSDTKVGSHSSGSSF